MATVSVHLKVEHPTIAKQYASALQGWMNSKVLPPFLGSEAQWEDNRKLCDSHVFKMHIRLPNEPQWGKGVPQAARKSNSYLVYARHWLNPDSFQVISIMTPNAHGLARTSFLAELERRAEQFQNT
ncbi:toxin YafO [Brenneria alni]|uniref:Toxin YafO n=1 Tax=Brenneria alni TaxID=71656 RepID=A0A421DKY7_9GAMM|nr:type II toxin-antitoxin system YafO family toxin [Brenneria alni]RLM20556.1 toxin YafO [Brenneria alni]